MEPSEIVSQPSLVVHFSAHFPYNVPHLNWTRKNVVLSAGRLHLMHRP